MYSPYAEKYAENFKYFCSLEKKNAKFKAEVDACHLVLIIISLIIIDYYHSNYYHTPLIVYHTIVMPVIWY
jgi:hypothetical protein